MITPANFCLWSHQDEAKRKPIFDEVVLDDYLTQEGFRCMFDNHNTSDMRLVRVQDNVITETDNHEMYHFIKTEIIKNHAIWLKTLKTHRNLMYQTAIAQLNKLEPKYLRDTATTSYIAFQNGIVCITTDGYDLKPYKEVLKGGTYLLAEKIIQRKFEPKTFDYKIGEWYRFCENAAGKDGISYLMRIIGYMLHTYKDKSKAKIVAFADAANIENPNAMGGTGKTIIAKDCLAEIRCLHWEDGKEFNPKSQFKFQGLNTTHEVLCLDDVKKQFDSEVLYNKITGNFSTEEKYKPKTTIDHRFSPKSILTTNFGMLLDGDSDKRRFIMFGFTGHYNLNNTPRDEFGHQLFEDWVGKYSIEYQLFYLFIFDCLRLNFTYGAEDFRHEQIRKKGINEEFNNELVERMEEFRDGFIGIDNAMQVKDWLRVLGTDDYSVSDSLKRFMDSEGYDIYDIRRRIQNAKNPTKLYYFEKR